MSKLYRSYSICKVVSSSHAIVNVLLRNSQLKFNIFI